MAKRSRHAALFILGAAAFALTGCTDDSVDAEAFPDLASCKAAANQGGMFSAQACEQAFTEAEALHVESAPRYDSIATCEEQHGVGACGSEQQAASGGSGSIFMPLLAGYLIGSMLGNARGGQAAAQPLYKTPNGGYTNAAGTSAYSSNTGKAKVAPGNFQRPAATVGKPPMTKATAASRGGFGASGSSAGG